MNVITRQVADKALTVTIEYPRLDNQTQSIIRKIRSLDFKINGNADGRLLSISISDIYYIEAVERKTFIYTNKEIYLSDKKLYELEQMFRETGMVRISKCCLMNMDMLLCVRQLLNSQLEATLILSAIIIFVVFLISYLFFGASKDILIVFKILLLSFFIVSIQQILRRNLFDKFLYNILIEYTAVSVFVLLYGYFFQWFVKANWWMVFLYVAVVYVPAYLLDMVIVKNDIDYINAQLDRRHKSESSLGQ